MHSNQIILSNGTREKTKSFIFTFFFSNLIFVTFRIFFIFLSFPICFFFSLSFSFFEMVLFFLLSLVRWMLNLHVLIAVPNVSVCNLKWTKALRWNENCSVSNRPNSSRRWILINCDGKWINNNNKINEKQPRVTDDNLCIKRKENGFKRSKRKNIINTSIAGFCVYIGHAHIIFIEWIWNTKGVSSMQKFKGNRC